MKKLISSKSRLFMVMGFLFAIMSISNSCSKSAMNNLYGTGGGGGNTGGASGPGTNEVWIQGMAFTPSTITVAAGTTITWTNKMTISHTVTSDTGDSVPFDSGTINPNGTFSMTFSAAGTYPYHCSIHPTMTAKVIVN